jgi:hypothetical protein
VPKARIDEGDSYEINDWYYCLCVCLAVSRIKRTSMFCHDVVGLLLMLRCQDTMSSCAQATGQRDAIKILSYHGWYVAVRIYHMAQAEVHF